MRLEQLFIQNFRNIENAEFFPHPGINFLLGFNAQGKTSFLEAIHYLSTLRSFRQTKSQDVIRHNQFRSQISCAINHSDSQGEWESKLGIEFEVVGGEAALAAENLKATKAAFINGKRIRSSTDYLTRRFEDVQQGFHSIVFNPSDHELIRGEPKLRRNYLNSVCSAEDPEYLVAYKTYLKLVESRNRLLKQGLKDPYWLEQLPDYEKPWVDHSVLLTQKRLQWLKRMGQELNPVLAEIAPDQHPLEIVYDSNWTHFAGQQEVPSLEQLEQSFRNKFASLERVERIRGTTLLGPHRDDWAFHFLNESVNQSQGQPLKSRGSQGEVRSALLALKLVEIRLFQERASTHPVLLLDDFSSELDRKRRKFLLSFLESTDLQVFVTSTESVEDLGTRYWVSEGTISRQDSPLSLTTASHSEPPSEETLGS